MMAGAGAKRGGVIDRYSCKARKKPPLQAAVNLVEHRGIEPLTSGLQSPRSPS